LVVVLVEGRAQDFLAVLVVVGLLVDYQLEIIQRVELGQLTKALLEGLELVILLVMVNPEVEVVALALLVLTEV
jgi:hypothetical protein